MKKLSWNTKRLRFINSSRYIVPYMLHIQHLSPAIVRYVEGVHIFLQ